MPIYLSTLRKAQEAIGEKGYYNYEIYRDGDVYSYRLEDGGERFVLDNFHMDPNDWQKEILILKSEDGAVRKGYFSRKDCFLNPILLGKQCKVVFAKNKKSVLQMELLVDRELYKIFETVYMNEVLGFDLLLMLECVEEPYWKKFVSWQEKKNSYFVQKAPLEFDSEVMFGIAEGVEAKEIVKEETDILEGFPEWICLYANENETCEGELTSFGYEDEVLYIDRVCEPLLNGEREIRLRCGKNALKTYQIGKEIPLFTSMAYLMPIRIKAKVTYGASGKEKLQIGSVEIHKSQILNAFVNQYFADKKDLKEEDLVEFFSMKYR